MGQFYQTAFMPSLFSPLTRTNVRDNINLRTDVL